MRGILFPSSNLIFTVQTHDPAAPAPKRPANQSNEAFSTFEWGQGIYKGWEIVDYAAIALAESAPLLLEPGRRCENGRPVPVTDPDWIKFTLELAETGRAAYKASQTRNQEVVSDYHGTDRERVPALPPGVPRQTRQEPGRSRQSVGALHEVTRSLFVLSRLTLFPLGGWHAI